MNKSIVALAVTGLLLTAGCTSFSGTGKDKAVMEKTPAPQPAAAPAMEERQITTMTATVQAVDLKKRLVTLKQKGGKPFTIHVSEEVRNLPQVQVGDQVVARYTEAMAVRFNRDTTGGVAGKKETLSADRAALGEKPAGSVRNTVEILANVLAIDPKTRKVTLQGPEKSLTVRAPKDVDISRLDVGDQILVTYTEDLAISVERAPAKKPAKKK
ncbi:MAG TPA: hypothetical protein P5149_07190 [Candidatus Competibacteraceae bacterium]|nr:hypothetical protein [Candidatus Competibacteraceae bacterium]MCP5134946.1 hypothetical protein [Gammaproteobacteria bacterium]HRY18176.1 hypothetical protein [Candidatus Competibacteraceae bacterium]